MCCLPTPGQLSSRAPGSPSPRVQCYAHLHVQEGGEGAGPQSRPQDESPGLRLPPAGPQRRQRPALSGSSRCNQRECGQGGSSQDDRLAQREQQGRHSVPHRPRRDPDGSGRVASGSSNDEGVAQGRRRRRCVRPPRCACCATWQRQPAPARQSDVRRVRARVSGNDQGAGQAQQAAEPQGPAVSWRRHERTQRDVGNVPVSRLGQAGTPGAHKQLIRRRPGPPPTPTHPSPPHATHPTPLPPPTPTQPCQPALLAWRAPCPRRRPAGG